MLKAKKPSDYVIATGKSYTVKNCNLERKRLKTRKEEKIYWRVKKVLKRLDDKTGSSLR